MSAPAGPDTGRRQPQATVGAYVCLRCRTLAQPGERRCVACGARFGRSWFGSIAYLVLLASLVTVLAVAVVGLWQAAQQEGEAEADRDAVAALATTTTAVASTVATSVEAETAEPQPVLAAAIEASAQAGTSRNSCGDATTYEPTKVQDGDPATAWRVRGDGSGQALVFRLAGPVRITEVGLIPGYAKIDPCSDDDRFVQMRRVTLARWIFDGGVTVDQELADSRELQTIAVDAVTSVVTLEILGTTGPAPIDYTPISEVALTGVPA